MFEVYYKNKREMTVRGEPYRTGGSVVVFANEREDLGAVSLT